MADLLECPECDDGTLREVVIHATTCCDAPVDEPEVEFCPVCGRRDPAVAVTDRYQECIACGYQE